jgi:hypothetical protein
VRFFLEHGIDPERLRAAGYADVFPKVPNRDSNGNAIPCKPVAESPRRHQARKNRKKQKEIV